MKVFYITYNNSSLKRGIMVRAPDLHAAESEFYSVYPDRHIISISEFRSPFKYVDMIDYVYTLEYFKRGSWRPVFYPPKSSTPIQSKSLTYVEDQADFISSKFTGERFRIIKSVNYFIKSYES